MSKSDKRSELRERNRVALIEATLDCVAEEGIARTSVSTIIERAGLSRGMIHLHFDGKDNLLEAAVAHANAHYYDGLNAQLQKAGADPSPEERIEAIVRGDLSEDVLNRRYVRIWYAFRGAAREGKTVAAYSDTRDNRLNNMAFAAFRSIVTENDMSDPDDLARDATRGTLALLEGMWTDYLIHPDTFDRNEAIRITFRFLGALMPDHFDLSGARGKCASDDANA